MVLKFLNIYGHWGSQNTICRGLCISLLTPLIVPETNGGADTVSACQDMLLNWQLPCVLHEISEMFSCTQVGVHFNTLIQT